MSDFDYKKYLAEGGIEAKLQENSVNEESVDEGVFSDIGKGIGGVATGVGKGVGAVLGGAGVIGAVALQALIVLVVIVGVGLKTIGEKIKFILDDLKIALLIPFFPAYEVFSLFRENKNKTVLKVVNRLKEDPEIIEYINNPSKRGLRNTVLSKLSDEEKAEIGTYIKNSFSRRDLDK
jgi:hypothetical protein